jgi:hypothetical protein
MTRAALSSSFYYLNNICRAVQITTLFIMQLKKRNAHKIGHLARMGRGEVQTGL